MNSFLGCIGFLINFLPLVIPLVVLCLMHSFSFLNYFIFCLVLNAINEAIKMQTKTGIVLNIPYSLQRNLIENCIINGTVTLKQRVVYFVHTFLVTLFGSWEAIVSIAIYAGIVTFVYKFFT